MNKTYVSTITTIIKSFLFASAITLLFATGVFAAEPARQSINGRLHVDGTALKDKNGNTVVLKGVSTHGLTWYPDFVSNKLFEDISLDWNCDLVRLAVYSDVYANGQREDCLNLVRKGIDAAVSSDMYVIVDWHVLEEHDPNVYKEQAKDFFTTICNEYPDTPNIIFEICNEPNGNTTWTDVKSYADYMIPVIRSFCPDSIILVGTPDYDKNLTSAERLPLDFDNIMYVLHFYATTHKQDLQRELLAAHNNGFPVFISECGITDASGDGYIDYESAANWFTILHDSDISFAVWSLSNKNESSAMIRPGFDPGRQLTENDLTPCGKWVRSLIQGTDPKSIPIPEEGSDYGFFAKLTQTLKSEEIIPAQKWPELSLYIVIVLVAVQLLGLVYSKSFGKHRSTYDDICDRQPEGIWPVVRHITLLISIFFTILYLLWRILYSIPKDAGVLPIIGNVLLLVVEVFGFIESLILYMNLMSMRKHPLPHIEDDEYPDVDIFIATYNEPEDLLRKTINGCVHLKYPDRSKVHIWLCDDNRRSSMRKLAEDMNIGYFDRPDNSGAKAGNLNCALARTSAPYIVTFDADMIPKSDFLLKTIPYFVYADKRSAACPDKKPVKLGLLQSPQCFYQPDVFQHTLYSEKTAPNEQDFFYRTIEVSKTGTNSVIYGGSNTVLSREALDAIGGFYTKTVTEDFATGLLLETKGFVSLAIGEPLASGMAPDTYKEHIQQRRRWGRGVIGTAKQLHIMRQKGLNLGQKLSYMSSVVYWFSPIKNLIYIVSPLLYATFAIPVFKCSWLDLIMYWLPMFVMQDLCLRVFSKNAVSLKWSGIYETSVMPHLLTPIVKEVFGMTASKFEVTDKTGKYKRNKVSLRILLPFYILIALSVIGIIRSLFVFGATKALGIFILLFWLIRNLYFLIMSVFIVNGRDSDVEPVKVIDAETVSITKTDSYDNTPVMYGVTTYMTEHNMKVFLDEASDINVGDKISICVEKDEYKADMTGIITGMTIPRSGGASCVVTAEVTDWQQSEGEYLQILYDRIPTLPQSLQRDLGIIRHMLINIAHRILGR